MNLKEKVIGVTIGIRYAKSFRIPDISGEIIDSVLYASDTPFGTSFFPQMQENSRREKTLFNSDTTNYLRINTDDLILGINIENNFDEKIEWLKKDVLDYLKAIFLKFDLKNIIRIGVIFDHKLEKEQNISKAIDILSKNKVNNPENVSISFSQKIPALGALTNKNINDYRNAIYTFIEGNDSLLARLDYQYYYKPFIEDLRECFSEKVISDSVNFLTQNYHLMLKNEDEKSA